MGVGAKGIFDHWEHLISDLHLLHHYFHIPDAVCFEDGPQFRGCWFGWDEVFLILAEEFHQLVLVYVHLRLLYTFPERIFYLGMLESIPSYILHL